MSSCSIAAKANELINQHFPCSSFNIKALAEMMHFHEAYLRKVFKANIGMSPNAVLKEVRMTAARKLLENRLLSVQDVASAVGIPDASYFCKCYTKRFGYPPSQERVQ